MGQEYIRSGIVAGDNQRGLGLLYYDDFEGLLGFSAAGDGSDYVVEHDNTVAFMGSQSLHLKTRTTGAADDDEVSATREMCISPHGIFLWRCYFMCPDVSDCKGLRFELNVYDGTANRQGYIYLYPSSGEVCYLNSAGGVTELTDMAHALVDNAWNLFQFKLNFKKYRYNSVSLNNLHHDFDDIKLRNAGASTSLYAGATVKLIATSAAPAEAYIDNLIIREVDE